MPFAPTSNTTITFRSSAAARFYADLSCNVPISMQQLPANEFSRTVYVRVLSTSGTLTASAPFGAAQVSYSAPPIVRRGLCPFPAQVANDGGLDPDGGVIDAGFTQRTVVDCPLPSPVASFASAFLLVQQTAAQPGAHNDVMARCRLLTPSLLRCNRRQGVSALDVRWQVVEPGDGVTVLARESATCAASLALSPAVDAGSAFLLRTLMATSDPGYDDEDAHPLFLTSGSLVTAPSATCGGYDVQVVEWGGVTVTRGVLDGGVRGGAVSESLMGLPPSGTDTALLLQAGTADDGMLFNTCSLLARGALQGTSELAVFRALGDGGCAPNPLQRVTWERIDFGDRARVWSYTVPFAAGELERTIPISTVDRDRTFALSSNQSAMGQGMGESAFAGHSTPAEGAFAFEFPTASTMRVLRGRAAAAASVTVYVVQVE